MIDRNHKLYGIYPTSQGGLEINPKEYFQRPDVIKNLKRIRELLIKLFPKRYERQKRRTIKKN
jgi:hypothetical protein